MSGLALTKLSNASSAESSWRTDPITVPIGTPMSTASRNPKQNSFAVYPRSDQPVDEDR